MTLPIFFVRRGDRLIARLKHMLYGWRFAKQVNGKVFMMWPSPGPARVFDSDDYSPSLIFDTTRMALDPATQDLEFLETDERFPQQYRSLEEPEFGSMRNNKFDREFFKQDGLIFHESKLMHYHFRDENPRRAVLNAELAHLFRLLPLNSQVTEVLARIEADLQGDPFVCLHARGGDVFNMLQTELPGLADGSLKEDRFRLIVGHYVGRTAPLEFYIPWIERAIAGGMRVVFSSDSPEQIKWFEARFGANHFFDLANYKAAFPIQKAIVDFLMLMRGQLLLGTRSNFSSFASDLANIQHVIVSAAANNGMSEGAVTDIYFGQAMQRFLPAEKSDSHAAKILRTEIHRHYRYTNRLGSKEELMLLDPRQKRKAS